MFTFLLQVCFSLLNLLYPLFSKHEHLVGSFVLLWHVCKRNDPLIFLATFLLQFYWSLYSHLLTAVAGMFQRLRAREDPIRLGSCSVIKHLLTRYNCVKLCMRFLSRFIRDTFHNVCPLYHECNIHKFLSFFFKLKSCILYC